MLTFWGRSQTADYRKNPSNGESRGDVGVAPPGKGCFTSLQLSAERGARFWYDTGCLVRRYKPNHTRNGGFRVTVIS